jgi:hypothetical protein
MGKCSTLMYFNDSLDYPNEKIVEIDRLLDDIDLTLEGIFGELEIEVSSPLVSKTMALVNKLD